MRTLRRWSARSHGCSGAFSTSSKPEILDLRHYQRLLFAALGLVQSGVPFYVKYHLGEGGASSTILLGTVIVMAIVFIPVWVQIVKR